MSDNKAKPIPFSGEPSFVKFLDDMASAVSVSRSGYLRQAAKEFAKLKYPQVYAKHFPHEGIAITEQVPARVIPSIPAAEPVHVPEPEEVTIGGDFLSSIKPKGNTVTTLDIVTYGAPSECPSCETPRYEYAAGVVIKTNVHCSTSPSKGKWMCSECTASGEYFPDKPATINE